MLCRIVQKRECGFHYGLRRYLPIVNDSDCRIVLSEIMFGLFRIRVGIRRIQGTASRILVEDIIAEVLGEVS